MILKTYLVLSLPNALIANNSAKTLSWVNPIKWIVGPLHRGQKDDNLIQRFWSYVFRCSSFQPTITKIFWTNEKLTIGFFVKFSYYDQYHWKEQVYWNDNFTFHIHYLGNRCSNSKNKKFQIYCYNILPIDSDNLFLRILNEALCIHWNMVCKVGWAPWNLSCFESKFDDTRLSS